MQLDLLTSYGFYSDFHIILQTYPLAYCRLTIEGVPAEQVDSHVSIQPMQDYLTMPRSDVTMASDSTVTMGNKYDIFLVEE